MTSDKAGRDALLNAVIDRNLGSVERLLASGFDPNAVDRAGWSALHFSVQNNDSEITRLLLKNGADHSIADCNGNTPLSTAVFSFRGDGECIALLLESDADPDQANNHGVSPRSLAHTIANYDSRKFFS